LIPNISGLNNIGDGRNNVMMFKAIKGHKRELRFMIITQSSVKKSYLANEINKNCPKNVRFNGN